MEEQYQVTCPRGHITHIQRKTALTLFGELGLAEIDSGIRLSAEIRCIDCDYCQDDADSIERENERMLGPFADFFSPLFINV